MGKQLAFMRPLVQLTVRIESDAKHVSRKKKHRMAQTNKKVSTHPQGTSPRQGHVPTLQARGERQPPTWGHHRRLALKKGKKLNYRRRQSTVNERALWVFGPAQSIRPSS